MADLTGPPQPPPTPTTTAPTFPLFPYLPTEIRLSIWTLSCLPRTIEIHSPRAHYANPHTTASLAPDHPPPFQSRSYNSAVLSVCLEARSTALGVYNIALPLASETHHRPPSDQRRVLYIAADRDTLVLLGDEPAIKVVGLMKWFRNHLAAQSAPVTGLSRIGVSAAQFASSQGAQILRYVGRDLFFDVERFVLVIGPRPGCGTEQKPPEWWDGGRCGLREFEGEGEELEERGHGEEEKEQYGGFQRGVGWQFREGGGWMVVGKNRIRIASVYFENGW
ncbi:hypothetical protein ACLOAV_007672 [Pseudogymnoascus australis]